MVLKTLLKKLNLSDFIALDFETTGVDSVNDRIIEVAAIRFADGKAADKFVKLVNPGRPIPDRPRFRPCTRPDAWR